jgi:hypothetical protein
VLDLGTQTLNIYFKAALHYSSSIRPDDYDDDDDDDDYDVNDT